MELKHESITLSSLVRRAASPNLLNLNLFFPRRWRRPGSRLSPFPLPPRPGYLKVPSVCRGGGGKSSVDSGSGCIGIHGGGVSSGSWGAVMGLVAVVEPSPFHCEDSGCFPCKTKEV